jgi:hypothetical protein
MRDETFHPFCFADYVGNEPNALTLRDGFDRSVSLIRNCDLWFSNKKLPVFQAA